MKVQELLIEELEMLKQRYETREGSIPIYAICDVANDLYSDGSIDSDERNKIDDLLREHFKTVGVGYMFSSDHGREPIKVILNPYNRHKSCNVFHWEAGDFNSRVQWIKDNINF